MGGKGGGREWEGKGASRTYLDGTADCDADGEIHLVLTGHRNGSDVFGGVTNYRENDEPNKSFAKAGVTRYDGINSRDHELLTDCEKTSRHKQENDSCCARNVLFFFVVVFPAGCNGKTGDMSRLDPHSCGHRRRVSLVQTIRQ